MNVMYECPESSRVNLSDPLCWVRLHQPAFLLACGSSGVLLSECVLRESDSFVIWKRGLVSLGEASTPFIVSGCSLNHTCQEKGMDLSALPTAPSIRRSDWTVRQVQRGGVMARCLLLFLCCCFSANSAFVCERCAAISMHHGVAVHNAKKNDWPQLQCSETGWWSLN